MTCKPARALKNYQPSFLLIAMKFENQAILTKKVQHKYKKNPPQSVLEMLGM